ncbi:MAG TPA: PAS domain-containing protein [Burkholderiales bacterium]|nr:PAS domain-containing protein [Burkholderiales bacterium]
MAARVRAFDWATTALGPVEGWPQSLRIAVGICLHSRFPMFVWWGPQLIKIYNDSYVPMLGTRHPAALGRPAQETWSDIWDVIGPQAEAVMKRGEATWNERVLLMMERQGYSEETYFTWSYSPIYDDSGGIGGVFCACVEETSRVLTERERDRLLKDNDAERLRLAAAFAQSPSFLAILRGPKHVFEYVNERYGRLIGKREVVGRPVREAIPEVEGQGFFEILDRVYATGEPFVGNAMCAYIRRHEHRPPEETFVDFIYQPMRGSTGEVAGILVHGMDVTERKKAEARDRFMLALEDALRPLTEPAQITATGVRLLGEYLQANRCAYADVEQDEDTFNLMGDYNNGVPSIVGRYRFSDFGAEVLALMRTGRPYLVRDVDAHQPPIGDLSYYRKTLIRAVICVPLLKAGKFVAAMAVHQATPRDWSDADAELLSHVASRCWESIERARVERTLRESEADFRELADAMPQIVFSAGPDGDVDYFNRQWYEYTGLAEGQIGYDSWKPVHTEDGLRRALEAWPRAVRTGEPYEIEYALRRHDGEYRWHLGRALPIRDENGKIVRWFGTNTDIHDRKQTEQALATSLDAEQRARSEAELASRMKDEFLANLSHELRTPLTAILGWSHILRRDNVTPQQLANGADVIERNARAQAQIIEDLLDMSAIISGKVRLQIAENVDLRAVVARAIETTRTAADAKRIAIRVDVGAGDRLNINADASRLQQVIWNLLSNAIKFTPAGGRVNVNAVRLQDVVEISVADTGEGIGPHFLPYVFDRFRQADASTTRRHGGLGIGLSIVKQLVELHGGMVRVFSEGEGRGSTFSVTLPAESRFAQTDTSAGKRRGTDLDSPAKDSDRIRGARILVVDDDADARDLLRRLLEDCGAQVALSGSSADAIEIIRQGQLDLVVSDIGMPGEDGYALMRRVRMLPAEEGGKVPALALTAYARAEDRVKAIRAGYQMHVPKPVDPAELIAVVASMSTSK